MIPDKETVIKDYQTETMVNLAKKYGVTWRTLKKFFVKNDIETIPNHEKKKVDIFPNLKEDYEVHKMSATELAKKHGTNRPLITRQLKFLGVELRDLKTASNLGAEKNNIYQARRENKFNEEQCRLLHDKEYLLSVLERSQYNFTNIGKEFELSPGAIYNAANRLGIENTWSSKKKCNLGKKYIPKQTLQKLYKTLTMEEIKEKTGVGYTALSRLLKEYGIEVDRNKLSRKPIPDKETLEELYEGSTMLAIAKKYSTSVPTVRKWFNTHGITLRDHAETISMVSTPGSQRRHLSEYAKEVLDSKELLENLLIEHSSNRYKVAKILGCSSGAIDQRVTKYGWNDRFRLVNRSATEIELFEWVQERFPDAVPNFRHPENTFKELDIYIPSLKIGIEYNGTYWHSHLFKSPSFHQQKSLWFEKRGIRVIHIWEWEYPSILGWLENALLPPSQVLHGRKCSVKVIDKDLAKNFLELYHLHGSVPCGVAYGIFFEDSLKGVMTFGKNRWKRGKKSFEILRMAFEAGTRIQGGPSKLFKAFCRDFSPQEVSSYSYIDKTQGNAYKALGMTFEGVTKPSYVWVNILTGEVRSRYTCQMKNEVQEMTSQDFVKVYMCGHKRFSKSFS